MNIVEWCKDKKGLNGRLINGWIYAQCLEIEINFIQLNKKV